MLYDPKSEARQCMVGVKSYQKPPGLPDLPPLMLPPQTRKPPPLLALGDGDKTRLPVAGAPPKPPPLPMKKGPGQPRIPLPELQPLTRELKLADESTQLAPPLPRSRPPTQAPRPPSQGRPASRGLAQAPVANMERPAPLNSR
jgi:hypothetical protein